MMRLSSVEVSDGAGEGGFSNFVFGEPATSDKDEDVPGLCLIFLDGVGVSVGAGVSDARFSRMRKGSS